MNEKYCKGINPKSRCTKFVREGFETCESHKHQGDYTEEQMKNLVGCSRCKKMWHNIGKQCNICKEEAVIYRAKEREGKSSPKLCKGKLINDVKCKLYVRKGFMTCRQHKFQEDYTDEQMNNLTDCSGCRHALCKECFEINNNVLNKICKICIEVGKNNRDKAKDIKQKLDDCPVEECKFKQINNSGYCGNHQINIWLDEIKSRNKKPCTQYIRGCRNELKLDDKYVRCLNCRRQEKDILRDIKKGADKMDREIMLSNNEILELRCKNCTYCKKKPKVMYEHGIDRIDNNKDYVYGNVTSCCAMCNKIKGSKTVSEFLQYCRNIHENYKSKVIIPNIEVKSYADIKYKANERKILFELSKDDYNDAIKYCCYYCKNTNGNKNGLDRLDSNKSYTKDNVVSCGICNLMKNDYILDEFIAKIKSIVEHNKIINDDNIVNNDDCNLKKKIKPIKLSIFESVDIDL